MNLTKIFILLMMVSSTITLSSSSFFLTHYLNTKLKHNKVSEAQFEFALNNQYIEALIIEESKHKPGSPNWLTLNKILAKNKSNAALRLAYWFQKEAVETVKEGSSYVILSQAIIWFEQAIRLKSQQAIVDLTLLYFQQGHIDKANSTLKQFFKVLPIKATVAESLLVLRLKLAIHSGEVSRVKQLLAGSSLKREYIEGATLETQTEINEIIEDIYRFGIVTRPKYLNTVKQGVQTGTEPSGKRFVQQPNSSSRCLTSLQLFGTNLRHLNHLEQLINKFKVQQPIAKLICLPTPLYVSKKHLECSAKAEKVITCDESRWQNIAELVNTRHIGLMLKTGGANVHLGVLYFDEKDDVDVFSHEVSHLLGFVDEYPLPKHHASCDGAQKKHFSHNIAVLNQYYQGDKQQLRAEVLKNVPWADSIKASTPIFELVSNHTEKLQKWRLGTPITEPERVGVYLAETCQKVNSDETSSQILNVSTTNEYDSNYANFSAYKPLSKQTQLRYYVNDFPREYLELIDANPTAYLMPSFHYNIALALYRQGLITKAKNWLRKASKWEVKPLRKSLILRGDF